MLERNWEIEGGGNLVLKQMTRGKGITENTECWFCHRNAKDVVDLGIKLGLGPLCDCPEEDQLGIAMHLYKVLDMNGFIPICYICWLAITELTLDSLLHTLDIQSEEDIITKADLKGIRFKIVEEK